MKQPGQFKLKSSLRKKIYPPKPSNALDTHRLALELMIIEKSCCRQSATELPVLQE